MVRCSIWKGRLKGQVTCKPVKMNIRFIGKSAYSEIVDILREHEYDVSTFELWNGKKVDNT